MATGNKRNTALIDYMAPDGFSGVTPISGRNDMQFAWINPPRIFGRTNRDVTLFASVSAPEGAIGVGVPWKQVLNPTCPHPKIATGGPAHKSPLLLANPTRGRAPSPKPGISYSFAYGAIDLGEINGGINGK